MGCSTYSKKYLTKCFCWNTVTFLLHFFLNPCVYFSGSCSISGFDDWGSHILPLFLAWSQTPAPNLYKWLRNPVCWDCNDWLSARAGPLDPVTLLLSPHLSDGASFVTSSHRDASFYLTGLPWVNITDKWLSPSIPSTDNTSCRSYLQRINSNIQCTGKPREATPSNILKFPECPELCYIENI